MDLADGVGRAGEGQSAADRAPDNVSFGMEMSAERESAHGVNLSPPPARG